jgi:hypothetical protein
VNVCMICRDAPATHSYDDWGPVYCCEACGRQAVAEIDRDRPAPQPRVLTPFDEGVIRVDRA